MHCTNCDYPLWNLKARQCPECGTPFLPSQFEFVGRSVQFCCPHCGQDYLGTDGRGHPDPREFDRLNCGEHVRLDEMVLRPAAGYSEAQTRPEVMPWLDRKHIGRVRAFWRTIRLASGAPGCLLKRTPPDASVGEAMVFMFLMLALTLSVGIGTPLLMIEADDLRRSELWEVLLMVLGALGIGAVAMGACVLWGLLAHAVLRMTGTTRHGLDRTLVALGYSSGASVITAVPVMGVYVGTLWWLISFAIAVTAGQHVRARRGAAAAFVPPVIILTIAIGSAVVEEYGNDRYVSTVWVPPGATSSPTVPAAPPYLSDMRSEFRAWGSDHAGRGPAHAIALLVLGDRAPFCAAGSGTEPAGITLGELTLAEFQKLDIADRLVLAGDAMNSMPEDVVAYRFGDFVFAYPGVNLSEYYTGLWIAVQMPDPAFNGPAEADDRIWALQCCDDESFTMTDLPRALADQNALRAEYGLPPLPDLTTIVSGEPAIADTEEPAAPPLPGEELTPPAPDSE